MAASDLLDSDQIKANLRTARVGRKVLVYSRTSSTNDIAAEYARGAGNDGLAVFAEEQTGGRGRAGAAWLSGRGQSILCSVLLNEEAISAELLSLSSAVAVAEAIGTQGGSATRIKWPNDILLNARKVAGILLESRSAASGRTYIVGVGINCHQKRESFSSELQTTATSIDIETQAKCDRLSLARRLLTSLDNWLEIAARDSAEVTERWRNLSIQLGHRVTLFYNGRQFAGNCIGIDPERGLILQLDRGGVRMFDAAHTTIARAG